MFGLAAVLVSACTHHPRTVTPRPVRDRPARMTRAIAESINVLEQQTARLELRLLEEEAQVGDLEVKLDEARQEVVRAMAKLQTLASKAEAASAIAEAEIAIQALQTAAGQLKTPEAVQAEQLLRMSTKAFDEQNYGGALYLANQAKNLAGTGQARMTSSGRGTLRSGEVLFAVPLRLQTLVRTNVRDGPGTNFKLLFSLDPRTSLLGYSYSDVWVRISDETGRSGWIFSTFVGRRQGSGR
jgi:multidrug efflux pump subunit AcrA (membrane-fusion protein)